MQAAMLSSLSKNGSCLELALVTANVGSIFENPADLFEIWISCFAAKVVSPRPPALLAVHLQEVGGKRFHSSMCHAQAFVHKLAAALQPYGLTKHIAFIDDENDSTKFTALGSIYFVHSSVSSKVRVWNFKSGSFDPLDQHSRVYFQEDLEPVATVHKHKFSPDMTPMQRSSRKGFLRTRWQLAENLIPIELMNVHLFHDESNFVAMQQFPSLYSEGRRRALRFALERIGTDLDDNEPRSSKQCLPHAFFIFGDFNFRLDTGAVVSWLSEGAELHETKDETGKLTRQEFHQRTISTTISTVTTLTKTTASHDDAPTSEESAGTHQGERAVSAVLAAQTESGSYKQKLEGKDSKRAGKMAVNDRRTTFCDAGGEGTHNRSEPRQVAQKQYKASDEVYHCSSSEQYQLQGVPGSSVTEKHKSEQKGAIQGHQGVGSAFSTTSEVSTMSAAPGRKSEGGCCPRRVLTLEKKLFELHEDRAKTRFTSDLNRNKLLSHDKEPEFFKEELDEFTIQFPPTYPYTESADDGHSFMGTRCPSWCDRVLFGLKTRNALCLRLIEYDVVGKEHCMGDHKPVLLRVRIGNNDALSENYADSGQQQQGIFREQQGRSQNKETDALAKEDVMQTSMETKANGVFKN
ncbi:type I inositol 1,4,5-trisphosphate 5-phosphatase-like isoform X2 [Varroa destructor]|uniref:inositol-polyphosphate 5-phosphatase n=1 Tax=Varroa destructor TaxID=109461 RepID=A0A7M7KPK0_VARDE|nr:type I inositol 1,4,5-trisphosphate 5-phosphatase-like isoform X2 [Varroa destructor]